MHGKTTGWCYQGVDARGMKCKMWGWKRAEKKASKLTFTHISNSNEPPKNVRAMVAVRWLVEGFLHEEMAMAMVRRYRRCTSTIALLCLFSHRRSVCFFSRGRRHFTNPRPGVYPRAITAGPVKTATPNASQDIFIYANQRPFCRDKSSIIICQSIAACGNEQNYEARSRLLAVSAKHRITETGGWRSQRKTGREFKGSTEYYGFQQMPLV